MLRLKKLSSRFGLDYSRTGKCYCLLAQLSFFATESGSAIKSVSDLFLPICAETILAESSQQREVAEFELGKLKESASLQKQDLEYQLQAKHDEIEHLKVTY